jgi:hypothetical protein
VIIRRYQASTGRGALLVETFEALAARRTVPATGQAGRWVDSIDPLGVVHFRAQKLIVEVQYVWRTDDLANFCAPIWLRFGKIDASLAGLARAPKWPIWDVGGGLVQGEAAEVRDFVAEKRLRVRGALILRPHAEGDVAIETAGNVVQATLGSAGQPLREGVRRLADIIRDLLVEGLSG